MAEIHKEVSAQDMFDKRKARIKHSYTFLNVASALCVLGLLIWAFVRLFFCWEDSCGLMCWFCGLHWVITGLLILFLVVFVVMSFALFRISVDQKSEPPEKINDPWIPGVKAAAKSFEAMAAVKQTLSTKLQNFPVAVKVSQAARRISSAGKAVPGVSALAKGTSRYTGKAHDAIRRMEHGRAILGRENAPATWTFIFTSLSLAVALFLMFGPFKYVFLL